MILTDKPKEDRQGKTADAQIHALEKLTDQSKVVTHEIRFMAPPKVGDYHMELHILNDSYLGLDETISVPFTVLPAEEVSTSNSSH